MRHARVVRALLGRFLFVGLAALLGGCSKKDPVQPASPAVWLTGRVTDAAGLPIAGAAVSIAYRLEGYDWCVQRRTTATAGFTFDFQDSTFARVTIGDYLHRPLRTLLQQVLPPGRHRVIWNGTDGTGRRVPGGAYFAELYARELHREWQEERRLLLLYCEPEERAAAMHATTDAGGRYRIEMGLLPIGEVYPIVDDQGGSIGDYSISDLVQVEASRMQGNVLQSQSVEVRIADRARDLQVDLRLP
jgi:hypothetical protein